MADQQAPDGRDEAALVRFMDVSYRYPSVDGSALSGVALQIRRGDIVGIMGATGAGKTTFCLAMNGIVPQFFGGEFFGSVAVMGEDTIDVTTSRLARRVGMVFEDPESQITATTVAEEVAFALENIGVPTSDIQLRVTKALRAVGLDGLEDKHPANLSGGQKQRLSIAAALALSPDLIVLDEPTSQLDPLATAEVFRLVQQLNAERQVTFVISSHASEELAEIADRIIVLDAGRVVLNGKPDDVFSRTGELRALRVRPLDIASAWRAFGGVAPAVTLADAIDRHSDLALPVFPACAPIPKAISQEPAVLSTSDLRHVYPDGTHAVNGINLSVARGEFIAIVGRNGSGKSTLVRHFLGLLKPTEGRVMIGDDDVAGLGVSELARRIGYISQNAHQNIFCDSVAKELAFAPTMLGYDATDIGRRVDRALEGMDLAWAADRHPMSLSRGDRLRVAIAATLALDPSILIFDEPTTGQDWHGSEAILDTLAKLNRAGATVVLITHHLYLLPGRVERLVMLESGGVVFDGPLRDAFYDTETMEAAGLQAPQTVRFAQRFTPLASHRLLDAADLGRLCGQGADGGVMVSYALQTLSGKSAIARLDMRVKFTLLLAASSLIFVWNSIVLQVTFLLSMAALMLSAGVQPRTLRRLVGILLPALILITGIQGLWSPFGVTPVFTLPKTRPVVGGLHVFYVEGLLFGLVVCCRVLIPMLAFQLVFMTSEPREIVLGLVRIGIPYRIAFLFSTTFRFVPLLLSELEGMKEAQRLRGVDIDNIGVVRKLTALARLLVPLIMNCLTKAQHMEIALQAKAFTGSKHRTYLNPSRETLTLVERALILFLLALPILAIMARILFDLGGTVI